jgi:hypothetical protein
MLPSGTLFRSQNDLSCMASLDAALSYIVDGAATRHKLKGLKVSSCAFSYLITYVSDLFRSLQSLSISK